VVRLLVDDDVNDAKGKGNVSARVDRQVPVSAGSGARFVGIDHHQLGAFAPRFLNERPEVNVGPVDVPAPGDDVFRFAELLRFCSQLAPDHCDHGVAAGGGADGAVQLRSAQTVGEA